MSRFVGFDPARVDALRERLDAAMAELDALRLDVDPWPEQRVADDALGHARRTVGDTWMSLLSRLPPLLAPMRHGRSHGAPERSTAWEFWYRAAQTPGPYARRSTGELVEMMNRARSTWRGDLDRLDPALVDELVRRSTDAAFVAQLGELHAQWPFPALVAAHPATPPGARRSLVAAVLRRPMPAYHVDDARQRLAVEAALGAMITHDPSGIVEVLRRPGAWETLAADDGYDPAIVSEFVMHGFDEALRRGVTATEAALDAMGDLMLVARSGGFAGRGFAPGLARGVAGLLWSTLALIGVSLRNPHGDVNVTIRDEHGAAPTTVRLGTADDLVEMLAAALHDAPAAHSAAMATGAFAVSRVEAGGGRLDDPHAVHLRHAVDATFLLHDAVVRAESRAALHEAAVLGGQRSFVDVLTTTSVIGATRPAIGLIPTVVADVVRWPGGGALVGDLGEPGDEVVDPRVTATVTDTLVIELLRQPVERPEHRAELGLAAIDDAAWDELAAAIGAIDEIPIDDHAARQLAVDELVDHRLAAISPLLADHARRIVSHDSIEDLAHGRAGPR